MNPPRILTVCLGNICRSPTAEAALIDAAGRHGLELEVRSAGTGDWHIGHPADPRMRAAAGSAGLQLDSIAEQVDEALLEWADLVLAMDRSNLADLRDLAARHAISTEILLFRDFDPLAGGPSAEVPDPYDGGPEGFLEVVDICLRTAEEIIRRFPLAEGELPSPASEQHGG